jgi:hypothetical protein
MHGDRPGWPEQHFQAEIRDRKTDDGGPHRMCERGRNEKHRGSHQSGRRHDAPRPRQPPGLAQKGVGTAAALGAVLAANGLSSRFATLAPLFAARRASALAQGDAGTSLGGFKPGRLLARGRPTGSLV